MYLICSVFREDSAIIPEVVPYVCLRRCKRTCQCPNLRSDRDNDARTLRASDGSTYCTCLTWCIILALCSYVLEPIAEPSHPEASALCKVLGTLRTIFIKLVRLISCIIDVSLSRIY
jgi:hypothetical protein